MLVCLNFHSKMLDRSPQKVPETFTWTRLGICFFLVWAALLLVWMQCVSPNILCHLWRGPRDDLVQWLTNSGPLQALVQGL